MQSLLLFADSTTFVYAWCAFWLPVVLAIGIYANIGARHASRRWRDALTRELDAHELASTSPYTDTTT
jgi:hypothetical protein